MVPSGHKKRFPIMANKKVTNEYNLSILFVPLQPKSRVSQSCVSCQLNN